jgi:serine/threonine-protein kinase RsbW
MLNPGETFSESYPAVPEAVSEARTALTEFALQAGADQEKLDAIRLATSEAVTNAIVHAYENQKRGSVQVSASYVENELWLLVADAGGGLRPRTDSPGLGLGLALIAQLADELQVLSRGSGGTELRLRFRLPQSTRWSTGSPDSQKRSQNHSGGSGGGPRGSVSTALSPAWSSFSTTR